MPPEYRRALSRRWYRLAPGDRLYSLPHRLRAEGQGWINAAFVRAQGVENLPIIAESGQIVGTGTPTAIPATATPTVIPAWQDGDSSDSPIASVIFDPTGTQSFMYNGDLSTPRGSPSFDRHTLCTCLRANCFP